MTDKLLSPLERAKVYEENIKLFFPDTYIELKPSMNDDFVSFGVSYENRNVFNCVFNCNVKQSRNFELLIGNLILIEKRITKL